MVKLEVQKIKFSKVTFSAFQIKNQLGHTHAQIAVGIGQTSLKKKQLVSKHSRQLCSKAISTRPAETFMFDIVT